MIITTDDVYTFKSTHNLNAEDYPDQNANPDKKPYFDFKPLGGLLLSNSYQVKRVNKSYQSDDKEAYSKTKFYYVVACVSRIKIAADNSNMISFDTHDEASNNFDGFRFYPVKLYKEIIFDSKNKGSDSAASVKDFFPITLNSTRNTSASSSDANGSSSGSSSSCSVGSSFSDTHTSGTSVSAGFQGDIPLFSAGVSESDSHTDSHSQSSTTGVSASQSHNQSQSSSYSMSMKDWSSLGTHFSFSCIEHKKGPNEKKTYTRLTSEKVCWFFSQSYPWDSFFINFKEEQEESVLLATGNKYPKKIDLSIVEKNRLHEGSKVLPPSNFSLTGFNFLTKATFIIDPDKLINPSEIKMCHTLKIVPAKHEIVQQTIDTSAYDIDVEVYKPVKFGDPEHKIQDTINLPIVALNPLLPKVHSSVIGFVDNDFVVEPNSGPFEAVSSSNNLYVCSNDSTVSRGDLGLEVTKGKSILSVNFKINDTFDDYHFFLKHWIKSENSNVLLKIKVNQRSVIDNVQLSLEGQGGQNNITEISLRNLRYASVDYHDYLRVGLNKVEIEIDIEDDNIYFLRALSIEVP